MTFQQLYEQKLTDPEIIATQISPGWRGFLDAPLGQPYQLIQRIEQRANEGKLQDLTLNTLLDVYPYAWNFLVFRRVCTQRNRTGIW